ncbi:MAG TPA: hypothetical protein VII69_12705 [Candidatus Eremiobacteraceae bacterium]
MRKISAGLIALVGVGVMAGCTTNNTVGNPKFTTNAKLQLAVGTLNDAFGTLTSVSGVYLNAVSTFRNQFGQSAFINPGVPTFALPGGGSASVCGLFSYGQNPRTMINPFIVNPAAPGPIGLLAPAFGEPPSFNPGNANGIGYALGYLVYLDSTCTLYVLPPAPTAGAYTLSTTVAVNGRHPTFSATATLGATPTILPAETIPVYAPGPAGSGGGTFTIVNPAGVTESLVYIVDESTGADISVEATGTSAVVPAGTLTPGDSFQAFVIGSDYPLFESSPPGNTAQAPTIVGAGGTADTTVSDATAVFTQP